MKVNHGFICKPNFIVVSNYVGEDYYMWGLENFDSKDRTKSDVGVWIIKYKK